MFNTNNASNLSIQTYSKYEIFICKSSTENVF